MRSIQKDGPIELPERIRGKGRLPMVGRLSGSAVASTSGPGDMHGAAGRNRLDAAQAVGWTCPRQKPGGSRIRTATAPHRNLPEAVRTSA